MKRLVALTLLLPALLTGCESAPEEPDPSWVRGPVQASSDRVVWRVTQLALDKLGYPRTSSADRGALVCESGWKTQLQPFRAKGQRRKAIVRMTPGDDGAWTIEARVQLQVNMTLVRPLDAAYAEWEWRGDDVEAARVLVQHIRAYLPTGIELRERPDDPLEEWLDDSERDSAF